MRGGADLVELGMKKQSLKVVSQGWDIVARNLDRIYELVMNMLAFSKQREPELEMTNLNTFLEEVVALVQNQYDAKKVALLTDFGSDVPPVPLDSGGVHQAVLNLLNNALDAVETESGAVSLRTEYDPEQQVVRIAVVDNGEGMTAQTQQKLFEPFHSTKGLRGTGLGLVVTKKVIEEHYGRVEVDSRPGEGTTFTLTIPVGGAATSAADTHGPAAQQLPEPQQQQSSETE
jgi:signal transduction histidine kinase